MGVGCACCGKVNPEPPLPTRPVSKDISRIVSPTPKPITPKSITSKPITPKSKTSSLLREDTRHRFNKSGFSREDPLLLIEGYLDEPIVSLEESLKPVDDKIDQLYYYIQEAKTKCHYPSSHGLTRNESAAIYIYTMKWSPRSLYDHLEQAWDSNDPSKMKPWFKYLRLLKSAFDKLPDANTEIWQVIPYTAEHVEELSLKPKDLYSKMGQCLPSEKELKEYFEKHPDQKRIIFGYHSINGKEMTDYAADNSKEVLVWPGMRLAVGSYGVSNGGGNAIFHLVGRPSKCYYA